MTFNTFGTLTINSQTMRDLNEKYYELNKAFPNKAGKLMQVITTQKRLIEGLASSKQTDDVKALLISVAEGYDVTVDLLDYMKNVLQGVANDAEALMEGSKLRNIVKDQSELIQHFLAKEDQMIETIKTSRGL
jgi:hypothetical protein